MSSTATNGHGDPDHAARNEQLWQRFMAEQNRILQESLNLLNHCLDPAEPYRVGSELWLPVGGAVGADDPIEMPYRNLLELSNIRRACRHLCQHNEFAINALENRISYIVGWGHTYTLQPRRNHRGEGVTPEQLAELDEALRAVLKRNRWPLRQQEIQRRLDRDGEVFLRLFRSAEGLLLRFVEPWRVATPPELSNHPHISYGIEHAPGDVETPVAYYVADPAGQGYERVDASEIQHRKANVDANWPRGLSLFYPVRKNLLRAEKHLQNMSAVVGVQAAIALIRKHLNTAEAGVRQVVTGLAAATRTNPLTGQTEHFTNYAPGTILDVSGNTEYDFPAKGLDVSKVVAAIQAELRAVASRLVMPEFMLSSDASNANYSSTLVAEGPATKNFERLQWGMIEEDRQLLEQGLLAAGASAELVAAVEIVATPPTVQSRNLLQEAQTRRLDMLSGILSPQTATAESGRDYATEQAHWQAHQAATGQGPPQLAAGRPLPGELPTDPTDPRTDPAAA